MMDPNHLNTAVSALCASLCNGAWRSTLVACIAIAGSTCLSSRNRTLRHAFWLTAMAAMAWVMVAPALTGSLTDMLLPDSMVNALRIDSFEMNGINRWIQWFVVVGYTVGAIVMAGRFVASHSLLFTLRENTTPIRRSEILDMVRDLSAQVGVRRETVVLSSTAVRGPGVVGMLHPAIVLPEHIAEKYPLDTLGPILIHELAHIRQRDHLINSFQRLAGILLFYHPLYWFISRQLAAERERSCDDFVVRITGSSKRYASCLAEMAEHLTGRKPRRRHNDTMTDTEQRLDDLVTHDSVSAGPSTVVLATLVMGAVVVALLASASRVVYTSAADAVTALVVPTTGVNETNVRRRGGSRVGNKASFRLGTVGRWRIDSQVAPTYDAVKGKSRKGNVPPTGGAD
ncbi:MAG: M56 family metallopeptidase [Candidatus Hydrogenedentes bacterium]|nr:M56 family metallopeptidase [Candidatus Hydrogenedentota bacterium]